MEISLPHLLQAHGLVCLPGKACSSHTSRSLALGSIPDSGSRLVLARENSSYFLTNFTEVCSLYFTQYFRSPVGRAVKTPGPALGHKWMCTVHTHSKVHPDGPSVLGKLFFCLLETGYQRVICVFMPGSF